MAGRLDGSVAVITGAASGIGRASTLRFVQEGARVVAAAEMLRTMQPWPEHGTAAHIAAAAAFRASKDARFITASALVVDGGLTALGSGVARAMTQQEALWAAAGMDRGTTGLASSVRALD